MTYRTCDIFNYQIRHRSRALPNFPRANNLPRQVRGFFVSVFWIFTGRRANRDYRLQSRRWGDFNLDPALTRPIPALQEVIKEVHHGGRHIALDISENLGCAIVGINGAYRQDQKEQPRPEWFARSLFNFPVVGNAHRYLFDLHSTAVGARLSTRGIGGFLKETKDVAALPAAYHEFTRVCGRPLGAKATGHLIHPEIQVSAAFLIHFGSLGKSAVAASGTFQLAGVSIS